MTALKNMLAFILYLFTRPGLLKPLTKGVYLPTYVQYEWLKKYKINTIIDIGANKGSVSKILNFLFPKATIYAFEPLVNECKIIKNIIKSDKLYIENIALSNKIGKATFMTNKFSAASSLLKLNNKSKNKMSLLKETRKIILKTDTLDHYFNDKQLKKKIFLKIDVQGTEKKVFEGGLNLLKKVSVIHVETSFEKIYKNQCLFKDVYNLLTKIGFVYAGNIKESEFYPYFDLPIQENSVFINKSLL